MALYVRVQTAFFSSRKTLRLRSLIGNDALWLPIRLWAYAAENQPDGDFSSYSADELALLVQYSGNAQVMLEALQQAGFMDGLLIHDWAEHNSYHQTFSDRAKAAAKARWDGVREKEALKDKNRKDKKGKETSIATSMLQASKGLATEDELKAYCLEIGLPANDGKACFDKWTGNGWVNNKAPIKDWRATIRSWRAQGYLPSQKNGTTSSQTSKPAIDRTQLDRDAFTDWAAQFPNPPKLETANERQIENFLKDTK